MTEPLPAGRPAPVGETAPPGEAAPRAAGAAPWAIWCDFGGVLTSSIAVAFRDLVAAVGVPAHELRRAFDQVAATWGLRTLGPLERGVVSQHDWGILVTDALGTAHPPRIDLSRFGDHWYAGRTLESVMVDGLLRARAAGLRVGLLTNSVAEWEPLRRALLPDWSVFESIINSHEIGIGKPDPAVYDLAERTFGQPGPGCVLIDDAAANCEAARRRGWTAIHHRSVADTLAELAAVTGVPELAG
ncbi:HAD-IA family hydrolase [Frankia sp. KB5]|uniref:HAD-IA family hydrolase n=1 Tax=Frankia sp. KB5 TaxID=683318 RepID=UPI001F5340BA|nr:HAD-IA family hydrolase [Frankia sp. KB5]